MGVTRTYFCFAGIWNMSEICTKQTLAYRESQIYSQFGFCKSPKCELVLRGKPNKTNRRPEKNKTTINLRRN